MQLKLHWPEHDTEGAAVFVADGDNILNAELVTAPGDVHIIAQIHEGERLEEVLPISQRESTLSYRPHLLRALHLLPPRLIVTATGSGRPACRETVRLSSATEHWLCRAALFVVAISVIQSVLIVPQLQSAIELAKGGATLPLMGVVVAIGAAAWRRIVAAFALPPVAASLAVLSVGFVLVLRAHAAVLVNWSLDEIAGNVEPIAPGKQVLVWGDIPLGPGLADCNVGSTSKPTGCDAFPRPETWTDSLRRLLLLHRRVVGCAAQPAMLPHAVAWENSGACLPSDGLEVSVGTSELAKAIAGDLAKVTAPEQLTVHWAVDNGAFQKPSIDPFWRLNIAWPEGGGAEAAAVTLSMQGKGAIRRVSTSAIGDRQILSPLPVNAPGHRAQILEIEAGMGSVTLGQGTFDLPHDLNPQLGNVVPCWMTPVESRIASVVLRGDAFTIWKAATSEVVTEFPLCWTGTARPRDGELQLDARWSPARTPQLTLPARALPERLRIIDAAGRYWGRLDCNVATGSSEWWQIGVADTDQPRPELRRLTNIDESSTWELANESARPGLWLCWPLGAAPPTQLWGSNSWFMERVRDEAGKLPTIHRYRGVRGKVECSLKADLSPGTPGCTAVTGPAFDAWFESYAPGQCDRERTTLCQ